MVGRAQGRVSEEMIGTSMKVKFLEVDEESERLVFSNRRASSQTQMEGHKVSHPHLLAALLAACCGRRRPMLVA